MHTEGEPNIELIEAETSSFIDSEIEKIPEDDAEAARECSGKIQEYLQIKAEKIFSSDSSERDVWLNYFALVLYLKFADKFERYTEYIEQQIDDFYQALDEMVDIMSSVDEQGAKEKGNTWHQKAQVLINGWDELGK